MIVSTNQPYFAPYPGFYYKALRSDIFVILDDVQFPRNTTWITRNRFKNDQGTLWMTIPVWKKGLGLQPISRVRICHSGNWKKKYLRSFESAYAKAPYLKEHFGILKRAFSSAYEHLVDLNLDIVTYTLDYLNIETPMVRLSDLSVSGKGTALTIDICKRLGATRFLVQSSALAYYEPEIFAAKGVELVSFKTPQFVYPQMWGEFIANLSILDMMFTCGPKSRELVRS